MKKLLILPALAIVALATQATFAHKYPEPDPDCPGKIIEFPKYPSPVEEYPIPYQEPCPLDPFEL